MSVVLAITMTDTENRLMCFKTKESICHKYQLFYFVHFLQEKIFKWLGLAGTTTNNTEPVLSLKGFYFPDKLLKNCQHDQR